VEIGMRRWRRSGRRGAFVTGWLVLANRFRASLLLQILGSAQIYQP